MKLRRPPPQKKQSKVTFDQTNVCLPYLWGCSHTLPTPLDPLPQKNGEEFTKDLILQANCYFWIKKKHFQNFVSKYFLQKLYSKNFLRKKSTIENIPKTIWLSKPGTFEISLPPKKNVCMCVCVGRGGYLVFPHNFGKHFFWRRINLGKYFSQTNLFKKDNMYSLWCIFTHLKTKN